MLELEGRTCIQNRLWTPRNISLPGHTNSTGRQKLEHMSRSFAQRLGREATAPGVGWRANGSQKNSTPPAMTRRGQPDAPRLLSLRQWRCRPRDCGSVMGRDRPGQLRAAYIPTAVRNGPSRRVPEARCLRAKWAQQRASRSQCAGWLKTHVRYSTVTSSRWFLA